MPIRRILFDIETPYWKVPRAILYEDSWLLKIGKRTDFHFEWIEETLRQPAFVVRGTTDPLKLAFISGHRRSTRSNSPLVVIVAELEYRCPVVSAGFRRDYRDLEGHELLWP